MIIIDQRNQTTRLYATQVTVFYNRAILVAVNSECRVKSVTCKIWPGKLSNGADPDQTPQNAAPDQGMHGLFKLQAVKG